MGVILLTGLDGSGKSTFLSAINSLSSKKIGIIYLPHMRAEALHNAELRNAAAFLEKIDETADKTQQIYLKAFTLFSSMLLYNKLVETHQDKQHIICERHPLIDTRIYALFYASKLTENNINREATRKLYTENQAIIDFILSHSGIDIGKTGDGIFDMLSFIHRWFHLEKRFDTAHLKDIFQTDLPEKIYYLRADPKVLINRLANRARRESHESFTALQQFDRAYLSLLNELEVPHRVVDTEYLDSPQVYDICKTILS